MPAREPVLLDVVELRSSSEGWPAGTVGTVVEAFPDAVMVEVSDDDGRGVGFPIVARAAVRLVPRADAARLAS